MSQNIAPLNSTSSSNHKSSSDKQSSSKDSHSVSKRLQNELMLLMLGSNEGISAFPEGDNLFKWIGTISGPSGTVYEKMSFKLSLEFPCSYPYSAPTVKFVTPCFHPNVDLQGNICLDILKEKWSASYDVRSILLSIQSLLGEPNNESPLNGIAAEMWLNQTVYRKHLQLLNEKNQNKDSQKN